MIGTVIYEKNEQSDLIMSVSVWLTDPVSAKEDVFLCQETWLAFIDILETSEILNI